MNKRLIVILALGLVAAVLAALLIMRGPGDGRDPSQTAQVGGPFQLVDQNGAAVDEGVLKGKWSAVFFGFTYCPDVCPTTLFALGQAEKLLGPQAKSFQTVFISVDPERDTPAQLKTYLSNDAFPKALVGLTGSQAQTDAAAKAYRVYHQKAGEGPGYLIDHSLITYLTGPNGGFVCVIPHGLTPEQIAEKVKKAMRAGAKATSC